MERFSNSKLVHAVGFLTSVLVGLSGGTCNEEQTSECRNAALAGRLGTLRSGGECVARRYMEFSHTCTVTNYLPSADYCCCVESSRVMCCRYHQAWNNFRCEEPVDVIDTVYTGHGGCSACPSPEVLIPAIVVPLILLLCCGATVLVRYCLRRRRRRHRCRSSSEDSIKNKPSNTLTSPPCVKDDESSTLQQNGPDVTSLPFSPDAVQLTPHAAQCRQLRFHTGNNYCAPPTEPSAPPMQDDAHHSEYAYIQLFVSPDGQCVHTSDRGGIPLTVCIHKSSCDPGGLHPLNCLPAHATQPGCDGHFPNGSTSCFRGESGCSGCRNAQHVPPPPYEEHYRTTGAPANERNLRTSLGNNSDRFS